MLKFITGKAAALGVASIITMSAGLAQATTFAAWEVANVPFGDTLNVRKYPASTSQKQAAYPNGTVLQMTGKCTGGVNLLDITTQPAWKQENAVRYRWCQIWHDPAQNGNFVTGWVYGKYISPY
ncbi:SH3 domain-containing protein [Mesorhizobium sp. 10J20-29]